mgnify:FL=1
MEEILSQHFQSNIQENKDWNSCIAIVALSFILLFQSNIQENKDWNMMNMIRNGLLSILSEQHPREQGLKLPICQLQCRLPSTLSEQHPREQGLKHQDLDEALHFLDAFRATSKRTRIETSTPLVAPYGIVSFQSNIQENKDWNS